MKRHGNLGLAAACIAALGTLVSCGGDGPVAATDPPATKPVATVTVSPAVASIGIGATTQLTAVTLDVNGNVLTGRPVAWSSADPAKVSVDGTGRITGVAV